MFSIPSIPTDNLYKFCFVSGVLLLLLSGFIQYNSSILQIKAETYKTQLEIEEKRDSIMKANTIAKDTILKNRYVKLTPELEKDVILSTDSIISKGMPHIQDLSIIITYSKYYVLTSTIGIILVFLGGITWYHKVQKPQDELLQVQMRSAKVELEVAQLNLQKLKLESTPPADQNSNDVETVV